MDFATLYEDDILAWSEQQVAELRRLAAQPALTNAVDWENVIEEIESLGRSDVEAVESLIENALVRILKIFSDPQSLSQRQWRTETTGFLKQARKRLRPSMARVIDLGEFWREAVDGAKSDLEGYDHALRSDLPGDCPYSLEDLRDPAFDEYAALEVLSRAVGEEPSR